MALVGVDTLQLGYSALMDKATGGCGRSGCVT